MSTLNREPSQPGILPILAAAVVTTAVVLLLGVVFMTRIGALG